MDPFPFIMMFGRDCFAIDPLATTPVEVSFFCRTMEFGALREGRTSTSMVSRSEKWADKSHQAFPFPWVCLQTKIHFSNLTRTRLFKR